MIETDDSTRAAKEFSDAGVAIAEEIRARDEAQRKVDAHNARIVELTTEQDRLRQLLSDALSGKTNLFASKDEANTTQ